MRRILVRGAAAVAVLLACTPTEPCACPPARTSLVVYGEVRTAVGNPAASAVVRFLLAPPTVGVPAMGSSCAFDPATNVADPAQVRTDAAGRFRSTVYSIYGPATRCLRVTASADGSGPESASVDGLLVSFQHPRPDSVGVVVTLR